MILQSLSLVNQANEQFMKFYDFASITVLILNTAV